MKRIFFLAIIIIGVVAGCKKEDVKPSVATASGNNFSVGKSANELLAASKYNSLKIEIAYMPGFAPDPTALANLTNFINTFANKPNGIQIISREIAASGKVKLTLAEVVEIEKNNRTVFNSGSTMGVFLLYADADYNESNIIGIAYRNTSMAIFGKTVVANSGGINQVPRSKLESTGLLHEMGHLFGLVNLGSPMQVNHEDAAKEKHCTNTNCLMYFATQTNMMGGILISAPIPDLDANCKNDLRANGGK